MISRHRLNAFDKPLRSLNVNVSPVPVKDLKRLMVIFKKFIRGWLAVVIELSV